MQHYTTIEQSKKLVELGLNPETADMFYSYGMNIKTKEWSYDAELMVIDEADKLCDIPCWSLGALLELMPKENENPFKNSNAFIGYGDEKYRCVYLNGDWESSHQTMGDTPIEAAYNMVCWLLENNYVMKGE